MRCGPLCCGISDGSGSGLELELWFAPFRWDCERAFRPSLCVSAVSSLFLCCSFRVIVKREVGGLVSMQGSGSLLTYFENRVPHYRV